MKLMELESVIEALLFISGEAISLQIIAKSIEMDKATTKAIINSLAEKYIAEKRGLRIVEIEGAYQMCTAPECFAFLHGMYQGKERQGMSQSLLETLAIVAYKQPITRGQIEDIRGVSAERAVNKLLDKGVICETGRLNTPGRPILFGTTKEFLRYFGFHSIHELPDLEEEIDEIVKESTESDLEIKMKEEIKIIDEV